MASASPDARALLACVLADDLDQALAQGLMDYLPQPGDDTLEAAHPDLPQRLLAAQARLRDAWAARERYRQRQARLARRAAEREARRAPPPPPDRPAVPALPAAAAAILARAKARAAGREPT
ncbi:hypothetical protein P6166_15335 [Stenotrophomonas sp. HITSZ_GD]|uniref:hypothetical protein n=1 Tax=Stenotrophomonas sp. HITSZ_GD TaxID=3037248 RepID=UPI00240DCE98|nr:hypothetical protein [Stenotrophomonas sp. HITSZ_GD]MDG2526728.1 hypothetical protein [Stenotrophomonas sp. HITSZ_GD]